MQRIALLVLSALALLVLAQPAAAQTTVYFTYYTPTNASIFPSVCGTGSLSCTAGTGGTYTCSSLISGTHNFYRSATSATYSTPFNTAFPSTCRGYTASNLLPITNTTAGNGINLQYGSTCINIYQQGTAVRVNPDARTGVVNFTWSTSQSGVASCPIATVAPTSTSSAIVGFVYTITNQTAGVSVSCVGNLQCTSYGGNEYVCPTLINGVQYVVTGSQVASYSLTGEVECAGFGDGILPLDYEGISFGGNFPQAATPTGNTGTSGCTSIYQLTSTAGVVSTTITYNSIYGANTFNYQAGPYSNPAQVCGGIYSAIGSSTGSNSLYISSSSGGVASSTGSQTGAASSSASVSVIALLVIAALTQLLLL